MNTSMAGRWTEFRRVEIKCWKKRWDESHKNDKENTIKNLNNQEKHPDINVQAN